MAVYGRDRNPGKIDPLAKSSSLLLEMLVDSPYAVWMCDDGTGAPLDKSGNGRHLTLSLGTNTYTTDPDYGTVLTMTNGLWAWPFRLPQSSYTLESWVKFNSSVVEQSPISDWGGNYSAGAMIYLSSMSLRGYHGAAGYISGGTLSTGAWYHLVLTWDGSIVRLYVNGVEVGTLGTSATPGTANGPSNGAFLSGYGNTIASAKVNGVGRGFAVYTQALSATRITAHYGYA